MGHFVAQDDLHRIDLGDGEWVDIKREFDTDDWIRVEAVVRDVIDADGQLEALFKNAKGLLSVAIKAWNLLGADGQPVPLSDEAIGHLKRGTLLGIAVKINELNPLRSETERKDSAPVSTRRSRRAGASRKS
jgi:hypothetical protein